MRRALADGQTRVPNIATVHDRLWRADEVSTIDLAGFLGGLCEQLLASGTMHAVSHDVAPVVVATDDAVTLGLLVNELVTNASKYASPQKASDVILTVTRLDRGDVRLEVRDHGPRLPAGFDAASSKSRGMELIARLRRQLGGSPAWGGADPGTRFVLEFTLTEPRTAGRPVSGTE